MVNLMYYKIDFIVKQKVLEGKKRFKETHTIKLFNRNKISVIPIRVFVPIITLPMKVVVYKSSSKYLLI